MSKDKVDIKGIESINNIKVVFKTRYNCNNDNLFNNSVFGSRYINRYGIQLDKVGNRILCITDKVDGQAMIESYADSCDINNIIRSMSVDTFNKLINDIELSKQYVDTTKIPQNVFEYQNYILDLKNKFDTMPADLKARFNSNANYFAKCCEDGSAVNICNSYFKSKYDELTASQRTRLNNSPVLNNDIKKGDIDNA